MAELLEKTNEQQEDERKNMFLTFILGNEDYGIGIKDVTEIIGIQAVTEVPGQPEYVKGIINLRGKIIPVVDVRLKFKKAGREYDDRTCIIVVDIKNNSLGLIVDRVFEVMTIEENNMSPLPRIDSKFHHKFIKAVGKIGGSVKLLIDSESLLDEKEEEDI